LEEGNDDNNNINPLHVLCLLFDSSVLAFPSDLLLNTNLLLNEKALEAYEEV
jgi:hypothetical protein